MPVRPRRRRPTPEEIAQQQRQPPPPYRRGSQDHGTGDRFNRRPGVLPVAFDPATGMIIPPNSPGGFYPPGFGPGPTPGTMVRPGSPAGTRMRMVGEGYGPVYDPGLADSQPVPIPGYEPGMIAPPPGAVPGRDPGTYIIPGEPGSSGDARGVGRRPGTPAQGPFPIVNVATDENVGRGPVYPPGHPQTIFRDIPPFPSPPDPQAVKDYHARYKKNKSGPYIDPYQMYDYEEVTGKDVADVPLFEKQAAGEELAKQRIIDSYKRNQLDPWLDQAIFLGMADLLDGLTPAPVHVPAEPARPGRKVLGVQLPDTPAVPAHTEPGTNILTAPLLNPATYPGGGGGIPGIPPLSDMLGGIGDALFPSFEPVPLGGISPQAPSMPRDLAPAPQTPTARPPFVGGY